MKRTSRAVVTGIIVRLYDQAKIVTSYWEGGVLSTLTFSDWVGISRMKVLQATIRWVVLLTPHYKASHFTIHHISSKYVAFSCPFLSSNNESRFLLCPRKLTFRTPTKYLATVFESATTIWNNIGQSFTETMWFSPFSTAVLLCFGCRLLWWKSECLKVSKS